MGSIVEAGYRVVQERTLPVIASEILQIEENVGRVALDGAIRIGERLKEAKEKAEHGQWEKWCSENLNYSKSKTEKLMKIAAEYGDENSPYAKAYTCTDLSVSKALRLLQVPEDEVESFAEENDVQGMTVKELEGQIRRMKEANIGLEVKSDNLQLENDSLKRDIENLKAAGAAPEKVAELEGELDKQKEQNRKLREEARAEKDAREKAVRDALEAEGSRLKQEAEAAAEGQIAQEKEKSAALVEEVSRLERKIENSAHENTMAFKLRVDQLQEAFEGCRHCIDAETDKGRAAKMREALGTVLASLEIS